jgi:hypothetical protein
MDVMLNVMHWRITELEVTWWIQNAAPNHINITSYIGCYAFQGCGMVYTKCNSIYEKGQESSEGQGSRKESMATNTVWRICRAVIRSNITDIIH